MGEFVVTDDVVDIIGLTPREPLKNFADMWYQVFLFMLLSSIFVHAMAAAIAFGYLRKHTVGRLIPIIILIMGVVMPITGGAISSAAIAGVYRAANFEMAPMYPLLWGIGYTGVVSLTSFTRFLATL